MRGTNDEPGDSDGITDENGANDEAHHDETDHDRCYHDENDRNEVEILGTTTVAQGGRISIVEGVREAFADRGIEIEEGDRLVYKLRDGHVVVELA